MLALALLLGAGCAAPLAHPTLRDALVAQERWPEATVASLEAGRRLFVYRCSGCHRLHQPRERAPEVWPEVLDDMERGAHVTRAERELIERFLVTAASQHQPELAETGSRVLRDALPSPERRSSSPGFVRGP